MFVPSTTTHKHHAMTSIIKYTDNSELFVLKTGEHATVEKGHDCGWGFTTTKGYNTWEGYPDGFKTKAEAKAHLKSFEADCIREMKYEAMINK